MCGDDPRGASITLTLRGGGTIVATFYTVNVMAARRDRTMLSWIVEMGEARLVQLAEELLANPTMAETFSAALHRAARTKGQVDRNMQMLLGLLTVPSKA